MAWITNASSTRSSQMTSTRLPVGADNEHVGWVGVGIEIHDDNVVFDDIY